MALPGGRKPVDRASSDTDRAQFIPFSTLNQHRPVHSARSFRALRSLQGAPPPAPPHSASASPSVVGAPSRGHADRPDAQTAGAHWPRSLAPSRKGGIGR